MHDANLFTSNFVVRLLFFFLGWSAICSLGKSLPHIPDGTSNFILSWVLRFPWGINVYTKNCARNLNRQGDRKFQFQPWFCLRPGSLSATLWAHFLCCRTVLIILDNTSIIRDNTSSQALGIKYEMPCKWKAFQDSHSAAHCPEEDEWLAAALYGTEILASSAPFLLCMKVSSRFTAAFGPN